LDLEIKEGNGPITLISFLFDKIESALSRKILLLICVGEEHLKRQIVENGGRFNLALVVRHWFAKFI